uniref:Uncharacterized protein n=1 Tax=Anguilla anguilla TaxID=7936 RepID=A0A0E9V137_ANGAN
MGLVHSQATGLNVKSAVWCFHSDHRSTLVCVFEQLKYSSYYMLYCVQIFFRMLFTPSCVLTWFQLPWFQSAW